jgi:hypothetical protein
MKRWRIRRWQTQRQRIRHTYGSARHQEREKTVACALEDTTSAQAQDGRSKKAQEAAGDAIGLPASLAAGLASSLAAGLAASLAAGLAISLAAGLASAEASGAGVSSDLLQADVAAKTIENRAKIRNFRITRSFLFHRALATRQRIRRR